MRKPIAAVACAFIWVAVRPALGDGTATAAPAYCTPEVLHGAAPAPFGAIKRPLPCSPLELQFPQGRIAAAVAATESDRERGLMGVRSLPAGVGMLFVFDGDGVREFWMKATLVPLDMVFVDSGGAVTSVAERVPATRPRTPDARIARRRGFGRYVIELDAGAAARLGLRPGARISIPAIPATP